VSVSENLSARFSRGFLWGHAGKLGIWAFTLLTSVLIANGFGPQIYGLWTASFSLGATAMLFLSLGLERTISVYLPRYAGDPSRAGPLVRSLLGLRVLAAFAAVAFFTIFRTHLVHWFGLAEDQAVFTWLGGVSVALANVSVLWKQIFDAQIKNRISATVEIVGKIIYLATAAVIVFSVRSRSGAPPTLAQLHTALIALYWCTIAIFALTILLYTRLGWPLLNAVGPAPEFGPIMRFSFVSWVILFVNYFLGKHADILLITKITGRLEETSYYNVAFGLLTTLGLALGAGFSEIGVPILSEVRTQKGEEKMAETWQMMFKGILILCFTGVVFVTAHSQEIVDAIYSSAYRPVGRLLFFYSAFYCVIYLMGGGLNTSILYVLNQERLILLLRLSMGILNLGLNYFWLIPRYGAMGAVIATGITSVLVTVWEITLIGSRITIRYPALFTLKVVAATVAAAFLSLIIPLRGLPGLIAKGVVYLATVAALAFLLKPLGDRDRELMRKAAPWLGWTARFF
jgi:O-antigen/teichoic acid export membrane protein